MPAIMLGIRPGDQERLRELADRHGRQPAELAGILLEQAIRREAGEDLADHLPADRRPPAAPAVPIEALP